MARITQQELDKEAFLLMARLSGEGYMYVAIEFDGSGDEGQIDTVGFDPDKPGQIQNQLEEDLIEWGYKLLDSTDVDWYNNDGGYGSIQFHVTGRRYEFNVHTRYTESELAAEGEKQFGDWTEEAGSKTDGAKEKTSGIS